MVSFLIIEILIKVNLGHINDTSLLIRQLFDLIMYVEVCSNLFV